MATLNQTFSTLSSSFKVVIYIVSNNAQLVYFISEEIEEQGGR